MLNTIKDYLQERWFDYATWATNDPDTEITMIFTLIAILLLTCIVLSMIMLWKKPTTGLERALMYREMSKALLFTIFMYAIYNDRPFHSAPRVFIYALVAVTSITVVFFALRENVHLDNDGE